MQLTESGFATYRCDTNQVLGIQFAALNKILKCMTSKDSLSIQAQDDGDLSTSSSSRRIRSASATSSSNSTT